MKTNDLTQGNIWHNLIDFSLPYILAYFLQILYGLADLYVIGRYGTVDDTTAVSNGTQVMNLVTVVMIGLAMGSTVTIARSVGAGDRRRAAHAIGTTFTFFLILSLMLTAALLSLCGNIVQWVATPTEAVSGTTAYLTVCFMGVPFIVTYNVIASIFRGMGDSRTPMYLVAVACAVNVALDFLLIGRFGLGPVGAALATAISQAFSVVVAAVAIRRHRVALQLSRDSFRLRRRMVGDILRVGLPVALQDGFIQVFFVVIMIVANMRGLTDAAAVGIVEKFIGLLFIIPSSMLSTVSAVSAQCIGARRVERAVATMWRAIVVTAGFGLVSAVLFQFVPQWPISLFTTDAAVIASGADYLQSYVSDCFLAGIHFCFSGFFTACGRSLLAFAHNMASILLVRLPLTVLLSQAFPHSLYPMGWASPAGSFLSVVICVTLYAWLKRRGTLVREF